MQTHTPRDNVWFDGHVTAVAPVQIAAGQLSWHAPKIQQALTRTCGPLQGHGARTRTQRTSRVSMTTEQTMLGGFVMKDNMEDNKGGIGGD